MEGMGSLLHSKEDAGMPDLERETLANGEPRDDRTQTPPDTRSTLSVLTNARNVPMLWINAPNRRHQIIEEIGTAHMYRPSILEQSLGESRRDAMALATLTHPALHCGPPTYRLEKDLAADFFSLLGKLMDVRAKELRQNNRKIHGLVDTHAGVLRNDRNPKIALRPDLFVQWTSPLFPSHLGPRKTPDWCSSVAVGEHQGRNKMDTFGKLGTYAEQVFSAQENRRFLQTFYFDNLHLVWCTFGRGGAVNGDAVDYHRDPWRLCALVLHFLFEGKDLGLHPTIRQWLHDVIL